MIDETAQRTFQAEVWNYYHRHGRHNLPWRQTGDAYKIMVSELMLQQTQVQRVIPKYEAFLQRFPTVEVLGQASVGNVLRVWSGLGYNRRAKFLHQAAQQIIHQHHGKLPRGHTELIKLSGIGTNTAAAILAYAYNQPVVFVETNIRTVFIYNFFNDQADITDKHILDLVEKTLDREHPREWYWALTDYGSYLKQTIGNLSRQSRSYAKQSKFEGSKRQIRGQILRALGNKPCSLDQLKKQIPDSRLDQVIDELVTEDLIIKKGRQLSL